MMKRLCTFGLVYLATYVFSHAQTGRVGIGESSPGSKGAIKGNLSVGSSYSSLPAPQDGAIIQGRVGIGTSSPNNGAILDIQSTDKGILIPRVNGTSSVTSPSVGMLVYNTIDNRFYYFDGSQWREMAISGSGGVTGPTGPKGDTGAKGNTGDQGSQGIQGPAGAQGVTGVTGNQGPQGIQGLQGIQGPAGVQGVTGVTGNQGPQGVQGPAGAQGIQGPQGATGLLSAGITGATPYYNGASWVTTSANIFNNGGNVGIGVASPNAKLEVGNNVRISTSGDAKYEFFGSSSDRGFVGWQGNVPVGVHLLNKDNTPIYFGTSGVERMSISASGVVRMNAYTANGILKTSSSNGTLAVATAGTDYQAPISAGTGVTISSNTINTYWTFSSNNLYSNNSGNVGIGITVPTQKLYVKGSIIAENGASTVSTDRNAGVYVWNDRAFGMELLYTGGRWTTALHTRNTDGDIALGTYTASATQQSAFVERMTLDGITGFVGINKITPEQRLDVSGNIQLSAGGSVNLRTSSNGERGNIRAVESTENNGAAGGAGLIISTSGGEHIAFKNGGLAGSEYMVIRGSGNVGIGESNPAEKLDVNGHILYNGLIKENTAAAVPYEISAKRYHVSSRYGATGRSTVVLDMTLINELCGDRDGCTVRLFMRKWSSEAQTQAATRGPYVLTYNAADGRWRALDNEGRIGFDGTQHAFQWWDCYLTDGRYTSGVSNGDLGDGFGLLNWNTDYTYTNKTCEITFDD